jgi:hypothetical protein
MTSFSRGIFEGANFAPPNSALSLCFDSQENIAEGVNKTINGVKAN